MGTINGHNGLTINGKKVKKITTSDGKTITFEKKYILNYSFKNDRDEMKVLETDDTPGNDGEIWVRRLSMSNQEDNSDSVNTHNYDGAYNFNSFFMTHPKPTSSTLSVEWNALGWIRNYKKYKKIIITIEIVSGRNYKNGDTYWGDFVNDIINPMLGQGDLAPSDDPTIPVDVNNNHKKMINVLTIEIDPQKDVFTSYKDLGRSFLQDPDKYFPVLNMGMDGWENNHRDNIKPNSCDLQNTTFWNAVCDLQGGNSKYGVYALTYNMAKARPHQTSGDFLIDFDDGRPDTTLTIGIIPYFTNPAGENGTDVFAEIQKITCIE